MKVVIINLVGKCALGKNFHKSRFLNSENEKNTCLKKINNKKNPVIHVVSSTTRVMQPGEVEGKDYYYISIEEHLLLRNEGQIFEEVSLDTTKYSHCKSELNKLKSVGLGLLETNPERMRHSAP